MKKGIIAIISVFTTLIVCGAVIGVLYKNDIIKFESKSSEEPSEKSSSVIEDSNKEYKEIDKNKVIKLAALFDNWYLSFADSDILGYVYKSEKILISDIKYEYLLSAIFEEMIMLQDFEYNNLNYYQKKDDNNGIIIKKDIVDEFVKEYYGPSLIIDVAKITTDTNNYIYYNTTTKEYNYKARFGRGGSNSGPIFKKDDFSYENISDGFVAKTKIAFLKECSADAGPEVCSVYKFLDDKVALASNVDSMSSISNLSVFDKLSTYEFTFKYTEDGNDFYLYSVELVK